MRQISWIVLFGSLLILSSCDNAANSGAAPELESGQVYLNYDGNNLTAPSFPAGTTELSTRFPASTLASFSGQQLTQVVYYVETAPSTCAVRIYRGSDGIAPDSLIYDAITTNNNIDDSWNTHQLTSPIDIGSDDLWISIRFSNIADVRSIGCDAGPRNSNGDFVLLEGEDWQTFLNLTGTESVNWNIRAVIE